MNNGAFPDILNNIITQIVNPAIYFLFALAILYFMWGGLKYIQNAADPKARHDGAMGMFWGIIGLAIMLSAFSLVKFIIHFVGAPADQQPTISQFK